MDKLEQDSIDELMKKQTGSSTSLQVEDDGSTMESLLAESKKLKQDDSNECSLILKTMKVCSILRKKKLLISIIFYYKLNLVDRLAVNFTNFI